MTSVLKASSYYPEYLKWFYSRHPDLRQKTYAEQHAALMADGFALSDTWSRYLRSPDGSFHVTEIVINAESLQKQWAREQGVAYRDESWMADIFLAQLKFVQPRVLYAHAHELGPTWRQQCRELVSGPLFILTYDGIGLNKPVVAEGADMVVSCLSSSTHYYRSIGVSSYLMRFGFDAAVLSRINRALAPRNLTFIGGLALQVGHQDRARVLDRLAKCTELDHWISGVPSDKRMLRQWLGLARDRKWRTFATYPRAALAARNLRDTTQGTLFGMEMFSQLAASKLTLNVHIAAAKGEAANIRLFESTGVGTCLLTDWKQNLAELFEPDHEVVTFRSVDEAVEKIRYLLDHEADRRAIAERGHRRTLSQHSYASRLEELGDELARHLRRK
jgi:spore maturation protein CgeB